MNIINRYNPRVGKKNYQKVKVLFNYYNIQNNNNNYNYDKNENNDNNCIDKNISDNDYIVCHID